MRLLLAGLPGLGPDLGFFRQWAEVIAAGGPEDFYASEGFHNYAPSYMYVLWPIGDLDEIFGFSDSQWNYVLKLPAIVADLGSAYVLYLLLAGRTVSQPFGAAALYLVFPPVLLIGAIWGQVDSILAFFILLTIYLLDRSRPVAGAIAFTVAFLLKPQVVAAAPFLIFWLVRDHPPVWTRIRSFRLPVPPQLWWRMIGSSLGAALVLAFPFFPSLLLWRPVFDLAGQVRTAVTEFDALNAVFAYNFWDLLGIAERCDLSACTDSTTGAVKHGSEFLGLTTRSWGLVLFALSVAAVIVVLRKARGVGFFALGTSLCLLAFYVFMTRMHERYLFPFFLPFLAACVLLRSRSLWWAFGVLGAVHFLNLYYVYTNDEGDLRVQTLYDWLENSDLLGTGLETTQFLSAVVVGSFVVLTALAHRLASTRSQ